MGKFEIYKKISCKTSATAGHKRDDNIKMDIKMRWGCGMDPSSPGRFSSVKKMNSTSNRNEYQEYFLGVKAASSSG
jgi:hypothetical protein